MRHRSPIVRYAGIAAASLLLTHATPSVAASDPPAGGASGASSVIASSGRAGMNFFLDLETDRFGATGSPRGIDGLSAIEQRMISRSTDGLFEVFHRDGSATLDLQGRFQEFTFVRIGTNGTLNFSCVDEYAGVREALLAATSPSSAWEER